MRLLRKLNELMSENVLMKSCISEHFERDSESFKFLGTKKGLRLKYQITFTLKLIHYT